MSLTETTGCCRIVIPPGVEQTILALFEYGAATLEINTELSNLFVPEIP
jgi:hypothetical protein